MAQFSDKAEQLKDLISEYHYKFPDYNAVALSEAIKSDGHYSNYSKEYFRKIINEWAKIYGVVMNKLKRENYKAKDNKQKDRRKDKRTIAEKEADHNSWWEDIEKGLGKFEGVSHKQIKTLEEALEFSKADLNIWEVKSWTCNSWGVTSWKTGNLPMYRNNYQVKVDFQKKTVKIEDVLNIINETLKNWIAPKINKVNGNKVGVINVGDFHIGADVQNLVRTLPYNIDILMEYLNEAVYCINEQKYKEVHINMLGDFFESISGLNHLDSWKNIGKDMYGGAVIELAHKVLTENFLLKINNLKSVNIIGGNHDRLASDKKAEAGSEGARILAYMFKLSMPKSVEIDFNFSMLIKDIDGIRYILFHGDNPIAKQDATKIILDFGAGENFTVVVNAHRHTRESKRTSRTSLSTYNNIKSIQLDELKYRMFTIASFFTGNLYSENLGFASTAGFLIIWNNGKNKPNSTDICLS